MNDYSDIRSHERYHLKNHIPMPMENRAVQFAPFAALTGYDEEIHEAARLTDPMENLSDDALATLNLHFQQLLEHAAERPRVRVTYFQPDSKKTAAHMRYTPGVFDFLMQKNDVSSSRTALRFLRNGCADWSFCPHRHKNKNCTMGITPVVQFCIYFGVYDLNCVWSGVIPRLLQQFPLPAQALPTRLLRSAYCRSHRTQIRTAG